MTDIESLERWHRLYEQGIDPDHDCRANASWADTLAGGYAVYGPCTVCGERRMVADPPTAPKPKVRWGRVALAVGLVVYYVVASLLLMQVPEFGVYAWILVPPLTGLVGAVAMMFGLGLYALWEWIRE